MRVWLLNFSAEREAEGTLTRRDQLYERVAELTPRTSGLVPPGDVVAQPSDAPGAHRGRIGVAFCPTPLALAELARLGAAPPAAPAWPVLRAVLGRDAAAAGLGLTLPGAAFLREAGDALERALSTPAPTGRLLARRRFGFAGKGRRILAQPPTADDRRFLARALAEGGVLIEPWLERDADFAQHGFLPAAPSEEGRAPLAPKVRPGEIVLGRPTVQIIGSGGVWGASRPAGPDDLAAPERAALAAAAHAAGTWLRTVGYYGPFGVDAFRYRGAAGLAFNPRCEVNARYTMAWALGMPDRPDLRPTPVDLRATEG